MSQKSLVLIEFNELCPSLVEKFIHEGHLPNFKKLQSESHVYVTDAEETGESLNPWVQWVTVHTGLRADEHQVTTLSQGNQVENKSIWDVLSDRGCRIWVCGSMNAGYKLPLDGYLLPDAWSTGIEPTPKGEFTPFYEYIRNAVQEHTNPSSTECSSKEFVTYLLKHGLSLFTLTRLARQIVTERFRNIGWKRAMLLDQIQFDVFKYYFKKTKPHFSTFFINSTAHYQHCYWREMDPSSFILPPTPEDVAKYGGAILEGYKNMDELIGKFLKLAGDKTTLVFCTALSQQPYPDSDNEGGRHYYRIKKSNLLVEKLGLSETFQYEPVMAEQFCLNYQSTEDASFADSHLSTFTVQDDRVFSDGRNRLFHTSRKGGRLMVQCRCTKTVPADTRIHCSGGAEIPFFDVFYKVESVKSARHHPDGMLWVRQQDKSHKIISEKIPLTGVAPMLLDFFDESSPREQTTHHPLQVDSNN
ncbi:hypothetical protein [Thalassoglobus sp.]|uniref:hypothetical protein n=1 Tax=Thalassoglobus sp. TaxID=2795869 RepID=UPI003AA81FB3